MGCYRTNGQRDGAVDCVVYRDQCDASLHGVVMGLQVNVTEHNMGW